jgi:HAD superfamily hydrolase (TIGR01457 family)
MSATVFDLDGVIWRGGTLLGQAVEAVAAARERGPICFLTNAAMRAPDEVAARLVGHGIPAEASEVMTSSLAAAALCAAGGGGRVVVVGEDGARRTLAAAGLEVVDDGPADWVVCGLDRSATYASLARAAAAVRSGARFVATNTDPNYPVEDDLLPGGGALVAFLRTATGVDPIVAGKPEPPIFRAVERLVGHTGDDVELLGDSLRTDIPGGRAAGWRTTLVLTGVTTAADLESSSVRPDRVVADLAEWLAGWS